MDNHKYKSTASELGIIWSQYLNDSLSRCILRYFLHHVDDENIRDVLNYALQLAEAHLGKLIQFFNQEGLPIPIGFTDEDVKVDAPRLFTDTYMIVYIQVMTIHGMTRYAGAVSSSHREDYIKYLIECTNETMELYSRATKVMLAKGIVTKPPVLNNQHKIDFVKKQNFLTGWFGNRRPINAVEISGTYLNLQKTMAKMVMELGFAQVAQSKEVREYMVRARKVCQKHFDILSTMLKEDNLHVPKILETEVTDSTVSPFSDKLMLFHISTLLSSAIGYYGEALSVSQRRDLAAGYARMIGEMGMLAEDGANLLIDNGWMEQPPAATDHNGLTNK
ncbi:hypothetical protein JOC95_003114 [Bacillus tianshenii]|uniref:Transcriptional regulator n=1 Tax=Sutcliffiella tianshenii TaxID=1463404 RepID=A0ABS2P2R0_9BACI|nr:DUF3231 family protein [Bacillus tianshenii]MBM7621241.1 hypothetical protein [Bacillus tianshenii]